MKKTENHIIKYKKSYPKSDLSCENCGSREFEQYNDIMIAGYLFHDFKCLKCESHLVLDTNKTVISANNRLISQNII